jgi:hypothetical protein
MEMQMKKNQQKNESEEEKRRRRLLMYTAKNPQELKEEQQEWEPAPILSSMYYNENINEFLATADNEFRGFIYFCNFEALRPVKGIEYGYKTVQCLSMNIQPTDNILTVALSNGRYQVTIELMYRFD